MPNNIIKTITIATRESPLALAQTELIKASLQQHYPYLMIHFLGITTYADKRLDVSLTEMGGKGLFVKELEDALLNGRADLAVHSAKDMPMEITAGLVMPVFTQRDDVRDAFVSNDYSSLEDLPKHALVGTSSLRRQTQIRAIRPDIRYVNLRGNVNTRLLKLDQGDYNAIVLAAAGLKRLNLQERIRQYFSTDQSLPAAGQAALGIECREDNENVLALIKPLNDEVTNSCVSAERALCRKLGGGCEVPVAAYAEIHNDILTLRGLVANADGSRILRAQGQGQPQDAENIGEKVADQLIEQGAIEIMKAFT